MTSEGSEKALTKNNLLFVPVYIVLTCLVDLFGKNAYVKVFVDSSEVMGNRQTIQI